MQETRQKEIQKMGSKAGESYVCKGKLQANSEAACLSQLLYACT